MTDEDGDGDELSFTLTVAADLKPTFGKDDEIEDQKYLQDTAIAALTLPAATGGNGRLRYTVTPKLPDGLTFDDDPEKRTLSGTPTAAQPATRYTYTVTDEDGDGESATLSFTLTVAADLKPTFGKDDEIQAQTYIQDTAIAPLPLPAATGGNPPLRYTVTPKLPDGLTVDPKTRVLSGTPTAPRAATNYTYTVTDRNKDSAALSFTITVHAAGGEGDPQGRAGGAGPGAVGQCDGSDRGAVPESRGVECRGDGG